MLARERSGVGMGYDAKAEWVHSCQSRIYRTHLEFLQSVAVAVELHSSAYHFPMEIVLVDRTSCDGGDACTLGYDALGVIAHRAWV
jgi:hypothetical protein